MSRLLLDSVTSADIPDTFQGRRVDLVAGYVDGSYVWSDEDWQRHAGKRLVRMCIEPDRMDAQVIDIEPGNYDARGAALWVQRKWQRGEVPTVYCFSDAGPFGYRISDVRAECAALGAQPPLFWIAQWDNDPSTFDPSGDPAIVAKQYANPTGKPLGKKGVAPRRGTGGHFDASVAADHWPGVDPTPPLTPVAGDPVYLGASATVVALRPSEVGWLTAIFGWPDGRIRPVVRKVYAEGARIHPYLIYPPADPDADPTEDLDAQPGVFVITVTP